ncbi:hypothetical protein [Vulgatibacter sp.]|uniref:hypothetical protein n=1 Tax=Vulgatibacter sp. TaxID=1971226 RepID=UPI003562494E
MRALHLAAAFAAVLAVAPAARADFNATSLTALYGAGFDDVASGMATPSERLFTLTLENSVSWKYGDSFAFLDMASGRFAQGEGTDYSIYAEWQPRLSFGKIFGTEIAAGPVSDLLLAAEVNRGAGFSALLGGLGTNLVVPGFRYWTLNAYVRKDNFNDATYQVTSAWSVPFRLGVGLAFEGFVDVYGTDAASVNILTQPQLLVDVGELVGARGGQFQVGSEVWIHHAMDFAGERYTTVAPQVIAKFSF